MFAVENFKALLRPTVTLALVGAYIYAALARPEAIEHLAELTLFVVAWWFADRVKRNGG